MGEAKKEEVSRVSIRDKLLVKEVQEMEENKPQYCKVKFDDPSSLHDFFIIISPEEGFWQGGRFKFHVKVPVEYNILPPSVTSSQDCGIQIFPKKEKYVFPSFDHI